MTNGNFVNGGYGNRARNGHGNGRYGNGASDQYTARQLLDSVAGCLEHLRGDDEQTAEFLQGLADLLDGELGTAAATDQGSSVRLPIGRGTAPADLIAPEQSSAGSFPARPEAWTDIHPPPSATDRRLTPRQRRLGHDRYPAQDSAPSRADRFAGFSSRFPDAAKVEVGPLTCRRSSPKSGAAMLPRWGQYGVGR